jgi:hypothetical protein
MWEQYRKTFFGMQAVIWLVTISVYVFFGQQWRMAATFFLVMQFSSLSGAVWAARIRAMMQRQNAGLVKLRRA